MMTSRPSGLVNTAPFMGTVSPGRLAGGHPLMQKLAMRARLVGTKDEWAELRLAALLAQCISLTRDYLCPMEAGPRFG